MLNMKPAWKRSWKYLVLGCLGLMVVTYLALGFSIGRSVKQAVAAARRDHPGPVTAALQAVAASERYGLRERNRAIWALGQLGDPAALPTLEKLYTGGPCDHEHALCQHELEKAIAGCRGGTNLSAPVWRHGELATH